MCLPWETAIEWYNLNPVVTLGCPNLTSTHTVSPHWGYVADGKRNLNHTVACHHRHIKATTTHSNQLMTLTGYSWPSAWRSVPGSCRLAGSPAWHGLVPNNRPRKALLAPWEIYGWRQIITLFSTITFPVCARVCTSLYWNRSSSTITSSYRMEFLEITQPVFTKDPVLSLVAFFTIIWDGNFPESKQRNWL